jgi:hypothetical protein
MAEDEDFEEIEEPDDPDVVDLEALEDEDVLEDDLDDELEDDLVVADEDEGETVPVATAEEDEDEDEDDEDETPDAEERGDTSIKVLPKRPGEFVCESCFLLKHPSQLADADRMLCRDCV